MRIAVSSLGCKTNQYEMDALAEDFRRRGHDVVNENDIADVYVLNTCTVTAEAERKSRQLLRRFRRQNEKALVVATGCYSERSDLSYLADIAIGTTGRDRLPQMILAMIEKDHDKSFDAIPVTPSYEELGAPAVPLETRAFLKIQDGCDNRCSYCAICIARGPARSRPLDNILREALELASLGFKELVLTGTNINAYGHDFEADSKIELIHVVEALDNLQGIERIRLGSLESPTITPLFLDRLSSLNHFCPSFHLSLQSGSDPILKRMARRDTTESFRKAVALIRDSFPDAGITADLIVGFPGESDEDFQKTLAFCDEIAFLRLHVFRFSARPGTRAATMPAQVPGDVVQLRSEILRKKSDALFQSAVRRHVGQVLNILVEQYDKDGFILGYTPEYIHVKAKPETPGMPMPARGDIIPVKIKGLDQDFATAALL